LSYQLAVPVTPIRHTSIDGGGDPLEDSLKARIEVMEIKRNRVEEKVLLRPVLSSCPHASLDSPDDPLEVGEVLPNTPSNDGISLNHSGRPSRSMTPMSAAEPVATSTRFTAISASSSATAVMARSES
jgi:hypothetical protein